MDKSSIDKEKSRQKKEIRNIRSRVWDCYREVNLDIGEYRKTKESEDSKLLKKIQEKYQLKNSATIIYTHGCRKKKGIFTRASIVIEEQKIAYNISILD